MPSSVPGYEYDVFISYRQKDNKYDGWVTEFIANLRKELEATFKEEIHIYSDENAQDGLHDIHAVKESLAPKLKCLIFIPIISQTYCDPKSYAWNNEFLVFKKAAINDPPGLKVRLSSGNVVSRIVPVRIHELDARDKALLEKEFDGPIRSIDFIFSAPGVNRPLRSQEDHPHDNKSRLFYRDQINKVANLIKEIILALQQSGDLPAHAERTMAVQSARPKKFRSIMIAMVLLALVLSAAYYFSIDSTKPDPSLDNGPISIAVLPLKPIGDPDASHSFADGVTEVLRSQLGMFPELRVKSKTSSEKYRNSEISISEIAEELNVMYVLEGSAQRVGEEFLILVQLVDARNDHQVWSKQFAGNFSRIIESQRHISESIAQSLQAAITPDIAARIRRGHTSSFEAYDLFLRAKQASRRYERSGDTSDLQEAIRLVEQALALDDRFAQGYAWLAGLKMVRNAGSPVAGSNDSSMMLAQRALALDSTLAEAHVVLAELYAANMNEVQAIRYTYEAFKSGWTDSVTTFRLIMKLGSLYSRVGDLDAALYLFDTVFFVQDDLDLLKEKFHTLAAGHQVERLSELLKQTEERYPDDDLAFRIRAHIALEKRDYAAMRHTLSRRPKSPSRDYDSYDLIYAYLQSKAGDTKTLARMASEMQDGTNDYMKSQLLLIQGRRDEALQMLQKEEVGWYTMRLCGLNPIYGQVAGDPRLMRFIDRNRERLEEKRDRIHQLEQGGYLWQPQEFFVRANAAE